MKTPWSFSDTFRPRNIALGAMLAFAFFFYERGPVTIAYFQAKSFCQGKPVLWKLPEDLVLDEKAPETGHSVSQFGVTFSSPWGAGNVLRKESSIVVLSFGRTWNMGIFNPAVTPGVIDAVNKLPDPPDLAAVFGPDAASSNFQLKKEVLSVTPDQISFWMEPNRLARNCVFLPLKFSETSGGETGIYEFRTTYMRGFQMGSPLASKFVLVDAYDTKDRLIKFFITSSKTLTQELNQKEIDTVLSTLRFVEEQPSPVPTSKSEKR